MSLGEIYQRGQEAAQSGATELHIVGGVHPDLSLDYYLAMLYGLKERFAKLHLQAFTAVEVAQMALASFSGNSTVTASSHTSENMSDGAE